MAEAFQITSTINWALSKLSSLIPQASSSSPSMNSSSSAEQELRQMESTMRRIRATLEDAEERDIIDKSEQLRLSELREVAYDMEDIIDDYEYEVLRVKVEARRRAMTAIEDDKRYEVFDWNSYCPEVSISNVLINRMCDISEKFKKITDDWERISLRQNDGRRRNDEIRKPMETTSFFDEDTTFGREDDKKQIIEWLLQGENEPHGVSVRAIIGMGGMGKTTLAQLVYHDPRVSKHFDLRAWVCVSDDFDVRGLLRKIIYSLTMTTDNKLTSHESDNISNVTLDVLYRYLKNKLEGKRFFIVLDDVWNQRLDLWESLKSPLNGVEFGKILLTTRNQSVAKITQTTTPITLKGLPFDDCLSLFVRIAFQGRDHNLHSNLLDIGRGIVDKCRGLPLAVKVLAGILRYEDEEEKWNDILDSELWEVENENNYIFPILKLSYNHMPVELRSCFKYLSLFAKGSELDKETIVEQWMSHGFLKAKGKQTEEDVGNSYFEEFLQRSLLRRSTYSKRISQHHVSYSETFVMHDLIHDLAQLIAKDEYLLITSDKWCHISKNIPGTIRHISIYLKDGFDVLLFKPLFESKKLRTLMVQKASQFQTVEELCSLIDGSYHNLTCLRTLILNDHCEFRGQYITLSDAFRYLKHLRYLDVSSCVFTTESLYSLYHLQTFISWYDRIELCTGIGDLVNLRHLNIRFCCYMHHEVRWLTNLRRLGCFKVGAESWQLKLRDLKGLPNLRGRLEISGLENVKCSEITVPGAFMKTLQGVEKLILVWPGSSGNEIDENENLGEHVFNSLQPHLNLLELHICGYPCPTFPTWLGDVSFSKLRSLYVSSSNCTSLPTLGQLPVLRRLVIQDMKRVKIVGRELLQSSSNAAAGDASIASVKSGGCFPSLLLNLKRVKICGREFLQSSSNVAAAVDDDGASSASVRGSCCFPLLESLEFLYMGEWEEWNGVEEGDFPRLHTLEITDCPKLRALPTLHAVTTLRLAVEWNPKLISGCRLPMLQTVECWSLPKHWRPHLPEPPLTIPDYLILLSIKKLELEIFHKLGQASMMRIVNQKLTSLQSVSIHNCMDAEIRWYKNRTGS